MESLWTLYNLKKKTTKDLYLLFLTWGATENMFSPRLLFSLPPEMKNVHDFKEKYKSVGTELTLTNISWFNDFVSKGMFSPENLPDEIPMKYFSCFTESEVYRLQNESFSNNFLTLESGLDSLYLDHQGWVHIKSLTFFFFNEMFPK